MTRPPNTRAPHAHAWRSPEPLFLFSISVGCGILLAASVYRPPLLWLLAAALACAAALLLGARGRARSPLLCALAAGVPIGALLLAGHDAARPRLPDIGSIVNGERYLITARVVREGDWRSAGLEGESQRLVFDVETESFTAPDGTVTPLRFGLRVTAFERGERETSYDSAPDDPRPATSASTPPESPRYGDRVAFHGKLREPRNFGNPGAFDGRAWLLNQGIVATAWTKAEDLRIEARSDSSGFAALRAAARRTLMDRLRALWPREQQPVMAAMLIGNASMLSQQAKTDFQRTGVYHILVVSGMHVGIIAGVVFWLLRWVRPHSVVPALAAFAVVLTYVAITDMGDPVIRSAIMLAIYMAARLLYRDGAPLNAIGIAALAILAAHPRALLEASFQLTFLAATALVGIAAPLLERTSLVYRRALRFLDSTLYDITLSPRQAQFRVEWRMVEQRLARITGARVARLSLFALFRTGFAAYELALITLVMQVALVLPMAIYFHRVTLMSLITNLAVAPLAAAMLVCGMLAVLLAPVPVLASAPAWIAAACATAMQAVVAHAGSFRFTEVRLASPQLALAALAAAAFAFAIFTVRRRALVATAGAAALALAALAVVLVPPTVRTHSGALEVTAIDVGQGDSLLVVSPQGKLLLIDAGGVLPFSSSQLDIGESVVSPYLWTRGIERLDAVALSHAHADHIGGMEAIIRNFRPRELWLGVNPDLPAVRSLLTVAREHGVTVLHRTYGDTFDFGGARVQVLAPMPGRTPSRSRNDDSLVLHISFGNTAALLAGDLERREERLLAARTPPAQVLKVAHHGSATSTTPELLDSVQPEFAVVSAGARNSFGHPRRDVLLRLEGSATKTYRTDTSGAVTFLLDGSSVRATLPSRPLAESP